MLILTRKAAVIRQYSAAVTHSKK